LDHMTPPAESVRQRIQAMKAPRVALLVAAAYTVALWGCSLSPPVVQRGGSDLPAGIPHSAPGSNKAISPGMQTTNLLFVANRPSEPVEIYDKRPPYTLLGRITAGIRGPNGMAIDSAGDLFVANVDNQTVTEYPPGSFTPSRTYRRGDNQRLTNPLNVAVG